MEKKYQEQLKYLQDEIQNEREMVNIQMARLRADCEQQVQHVQQINLKCKEYCAQLEQVGRSFGLIIHSHSALLGINLKGINIEDKR